MNRKKIVRGIQFIVLITLSTLFFFLYKSIVHEKMDLREGIRHLQWGWFALAAALALQDGVLGGLRIWVLGRVLFPKLSAKKSIVSEFVLMFCAGVTPGQVGALPSQAAVLVNSGMKLTDVATVEILVSTCTSFFFAITGAIIYSFQKMRWLVLPVHAGVEWFIFLSSLMFVSSFFLIILATLFPKSIKMILKWLLILLHPIVCSLLKGLLLTRYKKWALTKLKNEKNWIEKGTHAIDEIHDSIEVYAKRGKVAYLTALFLTFCFFGIRFFLAYLIMRGLGIPTEPNQFVALGPVWFQIVLVQATLNIALYLSPTPGMSGIAEVGSNAMMSPWVREPFIVPYIVFWRFLSMFLCMFVGGFYVFRLLGTEVLEERMNKLKEPSEDT